MSYKANMQDIIRQYEKEVSTEPTSMEEIAQWAISQGLWAPRPRDIVKICRDDLADAAREEIRVDSEGRHYRARHCVRVSENCQQFSLWGDIDTVALPFMTKSFSQRRKGVVGDCHKLKIDVDHFNAERAADNPYHLVLDFADDVAELEAAAEAEKKKRA